jgi:hypothetical protein
MKRRGRAAKAAMGATHRGEATMADGGRCGKVGKTRNGPSVGDTEAVVLDTAGARAVTGIKLGSRAMVQRAAITCARGAQAGTGRRWGVPRPADHGRDRTLRRPIVRRRRVDFGSKK